MNEGTHIILKLRIMVEKFCLHHEHHFSFYWPFPIVDNDGRIRIVFLARYNPLS